MKQVNQLIAKGDNQSLNEARMYLAKVNFLSMVVVTKMSVAHVYFKGSIL
jgi:hypothetical protein